MIGLVAAGGTDRAGSLLARMLDALEPEDRTAILPFRGTAIGCASNRNGFATDCIDGGGTGVSVLFVGELFDDGVPANDPAARTLALYKDERLDELAWWNGGFSLMIADPKSRAVILATDRMGHRPPFVWERNGSFAVATRLPPLLADDRVPRKLSAQGIVELASFQRTFGTHTQYDGIRSMPAASLWRFQDGKLDRRRTRNLSWRKPEFTEREGAGLLADALTRAVARRTSGGARAGLLLSGGLDARAVLGAASGRGVPLPCVTATSHDNLETRVAKRLAETAGAPISLTENRPVMLAGRLDGAARACDGLFSAPLNTFGIWPQVKNDFDAMLSGHGLDYTMRGYYLPCVIARIGRSPARLPILRRVPDGSPATVARFQRVGIPEAQTASVLGDEARGVLGERRERAVAHALEGCEPESPYDAWDGFILHSLGRHYAYSDFVAMETQLAHRAPALDHDVVDIYLAMPPAWRVSGRMARQAMRLIAPALMRVPDANTGMPADWPMWGQIAAAYAKAGVRRAGLVATPANPEPGMTQGSWADYDVLFRVDPVLGRRLDALTRSEILGDTGLFDLGRIGAVVEGQRAGRLKMKRVLWQLLTIESWFREFGFTGVVYD